MIGIAVVSSTAVRSCGSATGTSQPSTANIRSGCSASLPSVICSTAGPMPRSDWPTRLPPMTNSDSAPLACANRLTVRESGSGGVQPSSEASRPATIAMIIGLRTSPFSVLSTTCPAPPLLPSGSASASEQRISSRFSTIMLSASPTPATEPPSVSSTTG